jgi:hypothetical protein
MTTLKESVNRLIYLRRDVSNIIRESYQTVLAYNFGYLWRPTLTELVGGTHIALMHMADEMFVVDNNRR